MQEIFKTSISDSHLLPATRVTISIGLLLSTLGFGIKLFMKYRGANKLNSEDSEFTFGTPPLLSITSHNI
jgi:hypothetical protein